MTPNFAHTTLLSFLETLVNNALKLDPGTLNQLADLQGSVIHIQCTSPLTDVYITPYAGGILLQGHQDEDADCKISGSAIALLRLVSAENKAEILLNEDLTITGDTELSQNLQAIVSNLDIDWEAKIAEFVGDIAAHEIGKQLRGLLKWGQHVTNSLVMDVDEYLHEEARSLPPRAELDSFYQSIEKLAMSTDRLAARIHRIEGIIASNALPDKAPDV